MTSTVRLKHLCSTWGEYGLGIPAEAYVSDGIRLIRTSDMSDDGGLVSVEEGVFVDPEVVDSLLLRTGDLLISRSGTVGRSLLFDEAQHGLCTFAAYLVRFRLQKGVDRRFIYYFTKSAPFAQQIELDATQATIANFNAQKLGNLKLPDLSPAQQATAADLLDRETARIDGVLGARRRFLDLLDERSIALSWMAITGANRGEERRFSGSDWLGSVPASWPVAAVSTQFEVQLGRMLNPERAAGPDQAPYVRNANVRWDFVDVTDLAEMDFPLADRPRYRLQPRDVLINEGGAGMARSAIWRGEVDECYFQKSVLRLRPRRDANPIWMVECMRVAVAQKLFWVEGNVATIPHLPAETLRAHRFPFPDRAVQEGQLEWLDTQRSGLERARALISRQTQLLRERREALITAAVTGQFEESGLVA